MKANDTNPGQRSRFIWLVIEEKTTQIVTGGKRVNYNAIRENKILEKVLTYSNKVGHHLAKIS